MMRKIFGVKSISHLIYGLLMLAPILAIGVKCGYVMINKNAYENYSGQNYIEYNEINSTDDLTINKKYNFNNFNGVYTNTTQVNTGDIKLSNINDISTTDLSINTTLIETATFFRLYYSTTNTTIYFLDDVGGTLLAKNITNNMLTFNFTLEAYQNDLRNNYTFLRKYNLNSFYNLDNVFYYAIDEIIQDNNFGKINFTGWFDNMMLDNNIQINQTYTHLFNWYLNYTLFISCAYILWLVLMWFVNFARKLLDRGMNYDW